MEEYQSIVQAIALMLGASWASGINLYAAMAALGLAGATGSADLPPGLELLQNPLVIGAAGLMYVIEFFADKVPGVDSTWDALHTFIRIPAGALMAAGAVGDAGPALEVAALILGGGMATTSHALKASTRLAVNTSPEPFSNVGVSVAEDAIVLGGLWAMLTHPLVFLVLLVGFLLLSAWWLPRLLRALAAILRTLGRLLGLGGTAASAAAAGPPQRGGGPVLEELERLKRLLDDGAITRQEYDTLKARLR